MTRKAKPVMAQSPMVALAERLDEGGVHQACLAWINADGQVEVATTPDMSPVIAVGILYSAAVWLASPDGDNSE